MPVNKAALIRYYVLDKCFSNFGRKYFIDDLHAACKEALADFGHRVSVRQIYNDIQFMESLVGYAVPLRRERFDKKVYYRYERPDFSIRNQGFTEAEVNHVTDTLEILGRFKGLPNMDWIEDFGAKLSAITGTSIETSKKIIDFQSNAYTDSLKFFSGIFNAIKNQRVLMLEYKSFRQEQAETYSFSPYYLKEYNSRWFVIGKSEGYETFSVFALDRICKITETDKSSKETDYDFSERFADIIGVTWSENLKTERIFLQVHIDTWPYIKTKPLHESQRRWREGDEDDFTGISLDVQVNYELIANILYRGSGVKVIGPESLRLKMREEVNLMKGYYAEKT